MNILWIANIVFPEAQAVLTGESQHKSSGGWMLGASSAIVKDPNINLAVASCSGLVKDLKRIEGERILYYILPSGGGNEKKNASFIPFWQRIKNEFNPDVIHIWGTEYSHGHAYVDAFGSENVVVSIQGLTSIIERYYYGGLTLTDIVKSITFRDLIYGTLHKRHNVFLRKGANEKEFLSKVNNVIGRTDWDKAHIWAINPRAKYFFNNEILRDAFYDSEKWVYSKCNKHTIFASTAEYPIKGFHKIVQALPLVLREYPDTRIRVAGLDMTRRNMGFKGRLIRTGYGNYLASLIEKYRLNDKILFTGALTAEEMRDEYLKANVFICPSSIENSPNSLCEAQILGTPCISSYVGGVMNLTENASAGEMYRFEEVEMLAWKICNVFKEATNIDNTLEIKIASQRHDRTKNVKELIAIYSEILKQ